MCIVLFFEGTHRRRVRNKKNDKNPAMFGAPLCCDIPYTYMASGDVYMSGINIVDDPFEVALE